MSHNGGQPDLDLLSGARLKDFWQQRKGQIGLGILIIYLALLALGTLGEVLDIEWILNLGIFQPPGKF